MAIAPVSNHYLREFPEIEAKKHDRLATMWSVAAKVALLIRWIIPGALMINLFFISFIPHSFWVVFGLVTASLTFNSLKNYFNQLAAYHQYFARIEHGVSQQLNDIRHWTPEQIAQFHHKHGIHQAQVPVLALIARFKYWETLAQSLKEEYEKDRLDQRIALKDNADPAKIYKSRQNLWNVQQNVAIQARIQSALLLEMIARPHREIELTTSVSTIDLTLHPDRAIESPQPATLHETLSNADVPIGDCHPLSLGEYFSKIQFDRLKEEQIPYFAFSKDKILSAQSIERDSIEQLRLKLFDQRNDCDLLPAHDSHGAIAVDV